MRDRGRPAVATLAAMLLATGLARAEGLRISTGLQALQYATPQGEPVNLLMSALSTRVSRGRAGMTLTTPVVGISGGRVAVSDERMAVTAGAKEFRWGLGDMGVGLDYNVVQNRQTQHIYVVTLAGNLRFPTASTSAGVGMGEHLLGLGLSGIYGITRQLLAFADLRQSWVGVLTPLASRAQVGELGLVYWVNDKLGVTGSLQAANYGRRAGAALELNGGVLYELFPGFMLNAGGLGGLAGAGAARGGGSLGFGFEL